MEKKEKLALIDADSLIFKAYKAESEEEVRTSITSSVSAIFDKLNAEKGIFFISPFKTFKNDNKEYKANRKDKKKFKFFSYAKSFIKSFSVEVPNLEADDAVAFTYMNLFDEFDKILVALDKDVLNQLPGIHFNYHHKTFNFVEVSDKEAELFIWKQMIIGDPVDNIKGLPNKGTSFVEKFIEECEFNQLSIPLQVFNLYLKENDIMSFAENYRMLNLVKTAKDLIRRGLTVEQFKKYMKIVEWKLFLTMEQKLISN